MQRSPYSREATDISDQELRQILESENISGLPASYCLVPHYDGQMPLPQNTLWQHPIAPLVASGQGGAGAGAAAGPALLASAGAAGTQRPVSASSAAGGEPTRRRTRTTLTPYQLRVLFRVWERTQYPSSDLRFRLATNLMMTPRNVQIWFQNQRQKTKERAEMRRRTHSPSTSAAPATGVAGVQRPSARAFQQQPLASSVARMADAHAHGGYPGAAGTAGLPLSEVTFHYTHGPPPPPPAITLPPPPPPHSHMAAPPLSPHRVQRYREPALVLGALHMYSPPTLYPHAFSQPPPHLPGHMSAPYSHPRPSHPTHLPPSQPPPPRAHDSLSHLHRQRHASQPQVPRHVSRHVPPPPVFVPGNGSALDESPTGAVRRHMPPPAVPNAAAEQHSSRQKSPPSPLVLGALRLSPVMTPSLSSLNMDSPMVAAGAVPHAAPESPASRRVQLAEILNPAPAPVVTGNDGCGGAAEPAAAGMEPRSGEGQLGPLPSLETVLAGVQASTSSARASVDSCAPAASAALDPSGAGATATASDKWRPW
ncbi:hypothetical protein LPJ61_002887 [Coemansia biformis]|uniref:Homeobox domain-containing protein n=1 Tax=Coemansia biformis TaxID=1286918 RepID=A0A9W7Y7I3_9FUNG|nr:hypothetical protein LPJ61_002887 [Coemansia biformis]